MNQFRAFNIHRSRYVWDPLVHNAYNEHCYYFLLRLRDPKLSIVDTIQELLLRSGVDSSCIYVLYGYFDVLVRIWATDQKRGRFIRSLDEHRDIIEDMTEFRVHQYQLLWPSNQPALKEQSFVRYRDIVERVARAIGSGNPASDDLVTELLKVGLIHRVPARDDASIKFFIALSRIPGPVESRVDSEQLHKALLNPSLQLKDVSVYTGIGFCTYLVKAVVLSYTEIVKATSQIFNEVTKLSLRPMTLLIANDDAPECDHINPDWHDFPVNLMQLELLLGSASGKLISNLPHEEQDHMAKIFGDNFRFIGTPFDSVLRAVITARLEHDGELLCEKLAFLMRLEGLMRKFFVEVCSELPDWFNRVKNVAQPCGVDQTKNPTKDYTLHDLSTVLHKLICEGHVSSKKVEEVLGEGWKQKIDQIKPLRNDFAHGKFYEPDQLKRLVETDWYSLAQAICSVGEIYNALLSKYPRQV